jgi:hypothetical protein
VPPIGGTFTLERRVLNQAGIVMFAPTIAGGTKRRWWLGSTMCSRGCLALAAGPVSPEAFRAKRCTTLLLLDLLGGMYSRFVLAQRDGPEAPGGLLVGNRAMNSTFNPFHCTDH